MHYQNLTRDLRVKVPWLVEEFVDCMVSNSFLLKWFPLKQCKTKYANFWPKGEPSTWWDRELFLYLTSFLSVFLTRIAFPSNFLLSPSCILLFFSKNLILVHLLFFALSLFPHFFFPHHFLLPPSLLVLLFLLLLSLPLFFLLFLPLPFLFIFASILIFIILLLFVFLFHVFFLLHPPYARPLPLISHFFFLSLYLLLLVLPLLPVLLLLVVHDTKYVLYDTYDTKYRRPFYICIAWLVDMLR